MFGEDEQKLKEFRKKYWDKRRRPFQKAFFVIPSIKEE